MSKILLLTKHGMTIAAIVVLQYNGADWWHYLYIVILGTLNVDENQRKT